MKRVVQQIYSQLIDKFIRTMFMITKVKLTTAILNTFDSIGACRVKASDSHLYKGHQIVIPGEIDVLIYVQKSSGSNCYYLNFDLLSLDLKPFKEGIWPYILYFRIEDVKGFEDYRMLKFQDYIDDTLVNKSESESRAYLQVFLEKIKSNIDIFKQMKSKNGLASLLKSKIINSGLNDDALSLLS